MKKLFAIAFLATGLMAASHADAMSAQEAKAAGLIYETCDGYVKGSNDKGRQIADQINAKRRKHYSEIAKKRGVSVQVVAQETGQQLCGR